MAEAHSRGDLSITQLKYHGPVAQRLALDNLSPTAQVPSFVLEWCKFGAPVEMKLAHRYVICFFYILCEGLRPVRLAYAMWPKKVPESTRLCASALSAVTKLSPIVPAAPRISAPRSMTDSM